MSADERAQEGVASAGEASAQRPDAPDDDRETSVDGRKLRRDRNREMVVRSLVDLIEDGCALPTAAQIAERSSVSLRSVFRYFEDRDELLAEAAAHAYQRYAPLAVITNYGSGSFDERLEAIVAQRLRLFPAITPILRSVRLRSADGEQHLLEAASTEIRPLDDQVRTQFAPELSGMGDSRSTCECSLIVLLAPDTFELLTGSQRRTVSEVRAVYELTIRSLVGPR